MKFLPFLSAFVGMEQQLKQKVSYVRTIKDTLAKIEKAQEHTMDARHASLAAVTGLSAASAANATATVATNPNSPYTNLAANGAQQRMIKMPQLWETAADPEQFFKAYVVNTFLPADVKAIIASSGILHSRSLDDISDQADWVM
eukprot:TCALIF_13721-PA protein Name:"Protein of unknown function" AED:0.77 eAED:0.77 QI:21/0/0.33/0.33/1/1/3/0/143